VFCAAGAARQHCFDERGGAREARHTRFHDRRPQDRRANDGELAMNGVHDCGGMQCYGPIQYTPSEPPFHATWEARVLAMTFGTWYAHNVGIPTFRADIEALPPVDYLRMSYWERWFASLINRLVANKYVTSHEVELGHSERPPTHGASPASPTELLAGLFH